MKRYRIDIELTGAVSFQHCPIFDGILFGVYARWVLLTREGRDYYLQHMNSASAAHRKWIADLPILSVFPQPIHIKDEELLVTDGLPILKKDGVFLSSYLQGDVINHDTLRVRKKFRSQYAHLADFGNKKRKVRINNGAFKSYDIPIPLKNIRNCYFIFETDNLPLVEQLFEMVTGIGKKRNRGVGQIKNYHIDFSSNAIERPVPCREGADDARLEIWKPPYFLQQHAVLCTTKFL